MRTQLNNLLLATALLFGSPIVAARQTRNLRNEASGSEVLVNAAREATMCLKRGDTELLCQAHLESFKWNNNDYVFEKEEGDKYLFQKLQHRILIIDEDNKEAQCGLVGNNKLICNRALSQFTYEDQLWTFTSRKNGVITHTQIDDVNH